MKTEKQRYYVGVKKDRTRQVFYSTETQAQQRRRDGTYRYFIGAFSSSIYAQYVATGIMPK